MRISGGKARGIPIQTGKAGHVRPATDRMREAVFSSLGPRIAGARVLDLFAGSGSYALEAVSRGASSAVLVEKHPQAVEAIRRNIEAVRKSMGNPAPELVVIRRDVLRFKSQARFSVIFMDPPYDLIREKGPELLTLAHGLLDMEADPVLVCELPGDMDIRHPLWQCRKRIGKTGVNEPSIAILEPVVG